MFIGDKEINFKRGEDRSPRKTRSDKGRPRGRYKLRSPIEQEKPKDGAVKSAAKYGTGLLGTVALWETGAKLGSKGAKKTFDKIAPRAHPGSIMGRAKKDTAIVASLIGGDLAVRAGRAAYRRSKERFEKRRK